MTDAERRGDREAALVQGSRAAGNSLVIETFPGRLSGALVPHTTPQAHPAAPYARITLKDLFTIVEWQDEIPWQPFRDGVDIHRLYGDGMHGPTAALIRFREAGRVPAHEHLGYEHVFVLAGAQRDNNGTTGAGSLIISPPGTQHSIISEAGCIMLAIYEKPVRFLAD